MNRAEIPDEAKAIWPLIKHFLQVAALEQANSRHESPDAVGHSTLACLNLIDRVEAYLSIDDALTAKRPAVATLASNTFRPQ